MASSSGTSSGSSLLQNSGSEGDLQLQQQIDQRKRKRMISNRESAKRSRMRKQKHLDELMTQLSQLRKENNQIISTLSLTTQHYLNVEAENSVLRAQVAELSHQLQSLEEIVAFMTHLPPPPPPPAPAAAGGCFITGFGVGEQEELYNAVTESMDEFMNNSLSYLYANQPILASADMIQY